MSRQISRGNDLLGEAIAFRHFESLEVDSLGCISKNGRVVMNLWVGLEKLIISYRKINEGNIGENILR